MARRYSVVMQNGTNTAALVNALTTLTATAAVRAVLAELVMGSRATADAAAAYRIATHITTAPAGGTAITPIALDSGDPAAVCVARTGAKGTVLTTGPTLSKDILAFGLHQRAPFRWIANPGYEPKSPATANDGFSLVTDAVSAAFALDSTIYFEE